MKNIFLTLLTGLFISLSAFAQNYTVTVFGTVMLVSGNTISPVPDQEVIITIDSSNNGFSYQNTVYTDESGYYEDVISIPGFSGYEYVHVMTFDSCLGQYQYNGQFIAPGPSLQPMDFYLCNTGGGWNGCENYFLYTYSEPFTLTFEGFLYNGQYAQSYWWDFGDGTSGEGQTVSHTYTPGQGNFGIYMVGLSTMVMDSMGDSCFYTSFQEVWLNSQPECYAYFSYYPDSSNVLTINFLDMSSNPNGNVPDSWFWEFGDGTSSTLQNPLHTYADTGYYTVCLTIADSSSMCTNTYCEEVFTGYPPPPSECESYFISYNMYGLTVEFEGYTISQYETEYYWEFGDGVSATGQFVSHTYSFPGIYLTSLQTIDATGCTYLTNMEVWVDTLNQGCGTYFSYEQIDSLTFTFTGIVYLNNGMTYPDSSTVYTWDFGDGTTGTGQTITHTFQENPAGGYTVCLTSTIILPDGNSCTANYCEGINLVIPTFYIYGSVFLGNNLVADQAVVHLMTMDTTWQNVVEVQSTTIDSGGFYSFPEVSMYNSCIYYVQAELTEGSAYFGQYVPTYHISSLSWEEATPWLPLMNWPANIFMIAGDSIDSGNGSITGVVSNLGIRGFMNDVEVILMDIDKNPLTYLRSDEQGSFIFDGLAYGTYVIHAEIIGIHSIQAQVTLNADQPDANVQVQVTGGEAYVVFGVPEQNVALDKVGEIYPNPVNDNPKLDITVKKPVSLEISIFGQTGQLMDVQELYLNAGMHSLKLDIGSLPVGLYLLRITTGQSEVVSRKFMKIQ